MSPRHVYQWWGWWLCNIEEICYSLTPTNIIQSQVGESSEHTNIFVSLRNSLKNPDKISCTDLWGVLYVGRDKAGDQKLKIIGCYRYSDQLRAASHYYNYFHDATEFASHANHTNHRINSTGCVKTSTSWQHSDGQQCSEDWKGYKCAVHCFNACRPVGSLSCIIVISFDNFTHFSTLHKHSPRPWGNQQTQFILMWVKSNKVQ